MKKSFVAFLAFLAFSASFAPSAQAAIGCVLSNPAEDIKYLYPEMTSYKEDLKEFGRLKDGKALYQSLVERLGGDVDQVYEGFETPYTVYRVYKGEKKIGVIHGVNVPGKGGVIQVFLSLDPTTGEIRRLFFQRLESPAAKALKAKTFRSQFEGLTLADFYKHDYYAVVDPGASADRVARIVQPELESGSRQDYDASLRGVRKNLILLDFFEWGRKFEPFYDKAKEEIRKKKSSKGDRHEKIVD